MQQITLFWSSSWFWVWLGNVLQIELVKVPLSSQNLPFPLWHPVNSITTTAVITVNTALPDVTAQESFYTPKASSVSFHREHSFFVEPVQRSWVWTEMGDDAVVQCPKSRTGNKYLGHGPQTLARLCPTCSGYELWSCGSHTPPSKRAAQSPSFLFEYVVLPLICSNEKKNVWRATAIKATNDLHVNIPCYISIKRIFSLSC